MCRINGQELPCRYQDVRHTLLIAITYFATHTSDAAAEALKVIVEYIAAMPPGSHQLVGTLYDTGTNRWTHTTALKQRQRLAAAIHYTVTNVLRIEGAMAVRVANGARRLAPMGRRQG